MNIKPVDDSFQWYVVHTNLRQEERADSNLRAWGVETVYPKVKARRFNEFTGAPTYITKPLFSRYIFARFNAHSQLGKISFTRGVHDVVSFGGKPVIVDEDIIRIIRARIDSNGFVEMGQLKLGDKVVIKAGPLRNFEGIFDRELQDKDRIAILLTTVTYQGRLMISKDLLEKVSG